MLGRWKRLHRRLKDDGQAEPPLRPISHRMLLLAVAVVAVAGSALTWWLLHIASTAPSQAATVQIDAIRTGLTAAVGTGGAFALLLAFRRQRSTEVSAVYTITDATERRVTELYTKAADQLGNDKAPVRLAGLYALERLAQDNPTQRQTITNVICAYLQMPYEPPGAPPNNPSSIDTSRLAPEQYDRLTQGYERLVELHEKSWQEQRVRVAAQEIIAWHLVNTESTEDLYWAVTVDLSDGYLRGADFLVAQLPAARFTRADLCQARFCQASLELANLSDADLSNADFTAAKVVSTSFIGANLSRAVLKGADLLNCQWSGARLVRTDFTDALHLDVESLKDAYGDESTILPEGVSMPESWSKRTS